MGHAGKRNDRKLYHLLIDSSWTRLQRGGVWAGAQLLAQIDLPPALPAQPVGFGARTAHLGNRGVGVLVFLLADATGGTADLDQVIAIVNSSGALDYCRQRAHEETEAALQALQALPDSQYRQALVNLTQLALHRIQ